MTQPLPPARPDHLPEKPAFPRDSRYQRRKRFISWWGIFFGVVLGIGAGLYYAWVLSPLEEFNTAPYQLSQTDKSHYAVAVALDYSRTGDLTAAITRLIELDLGNDPIQGVADVACDLARTGYVDSSSGLRAVRALKTFYQLQGRAGCADMLIPDVDATQVVEITVPTATPTLPPPPSKTPTIAPPQATPTLTGIFVVPTTRPQRRFEGRLVGTYCDVELSGLIEVRVQDVNGRPIPGETVRVRWDNGEDRFVSGLMPERGSDYADFRMQAGRGYTIDMPGLADPLSRPIVADECITETGQTATTSYYVVFRQVG